MGCLGVKIAIKGDRMQTGMVCISDVSCLAKERVGLRECGRDKKMKEIIETNKSTNPIISERNRDIRNIDGEEGS